MMNRSDYQTVEVYYFDTQAAVPTHREWPVLIYGGVFRGAQDVRGLLVRTLSENCWGGFRSRQISTIDHFHLRTHEILGVTRGHAVLGLGGTSGRIAQLVPGDLLLLPVGVGIRLISSSSDLEVVGAYPEGHAGSDLIDNRQLPVETATRIAEEVPCPLTDPLFGRDGPLFDFWYERSPTFRNDNNNPQPKDNTMKLNEVMSRKPEYVPLNAALIEVARRMRELDVGMLPVGDGVKLRGMVTDRDIAVRATAEGLDPQSTKASDIMTEEVLYAYEDEEVDKAIQTMRDKQVRRLIILNRDKDMVGVVALGDIATGAGDAEAKAEAVEAVSKD